MVKTATIQTPPRIPCAVPDCPNLAVAAVTKIRGELLFLCKNHQNLTMDNILDIVLPRID